jgi:hypothetical protein
MGKIGTDLMVIWKMPFKSVVLLFLLGGSLPVSANELIIAAERNDVERISQLLAAGAEIDASDAQGRTALLAATHANSVNAARVLIDHGADVNAKDKLQDSAFLYAAAEGRLEILELTLAAGADLASVNRYGGTGLIPAAHQSVSI